MSVKALYYVFIDRPGFRYLEVLEFWLVFFHCPTIARGSLLSIETLPE
ncbi:MAG: hypothetical protein QM426_11270 [Euryarchaeota archaeon]|nr:hypothetical protein [Euryarchaeota archaeon]